MSAPLPRRGNQIGQGTIGAIIGEVRGHFGRDERFRQATMYLQPGKVAPLAATIDGTDYLYRRQVLRDKGNIANVTRDSEGKITGGNVGPGNTLVVREELTLTRGDTRVTLTSEKMTLRTIDRIGDPTRETVLNESGSMVLKEGDTEEIVIFDPTEARGRLEKFY